MCLYVLVCMHVCVCVHACVCVHVCVHVCVCVCDYHCTNVIYTERHRYDLNIKLACSHASKTFVYYGCIGALRNGRFVPK